MSDPSGVDLDPEDEAQAYERLRPRLAVLWKEVFPRDDQAYTSVIVPSVTLDAEALARHSEALYYEEALLFLLIRLRNPPSRVIYVTSRPLPQVVLDYYLQFLSGIPLADLSGPGPAQLYSIAPVAAPRASSKESAQ